MFNHDLGLPNERACEFSWYVWEQSCLKWAKLIYWDFSSRFIVGVFEYGHWFINFFSTL